MLYENEQLRSDALEKTFWICFHHKQFSIHQPFTRQVKEVELLTLCIYEFKNTDFQQTED